MACSKSVKGLVKWQRFKEPKLAQLDKVLYDRFIAMCSKRKLLTGTAVIENAKSFLIMMIWK